MSTVHSTRFSLAMYSVCYNYKFGQFPDKNGEFLTSKNFYLHSSGKLEENVCHAPKVILISYSIKLLVLEK